MKRTDFCGGWTYRIWGVPGDTPVTLPHDYSQHLPRTPDSKSGSAGGWFQGANIIYDKEKDEFDDYIHNKNDELIQINDGEYFTPEELMVNDGFEY